MVAEVAGVAVAVAEAEVEVVEVAEEEVSIRSDPACPTPPTFLACRTWSPTRTRALTPSPSGQRCREFR